MTPPPLGWAYSLRLPDWAKTSVPMGENFTRIKENLRDLKLHTVERTGLPVGQNQAGWGRR